MIYNDILSNGLGTRSLLGLLFGETERDMRRLIRNPERIDIAYNASILYTALLQAYGICKTIEMGETVSSGSLPYDVSSIIHATWVPDPNGKRGYGLSDDEKKKRFFSFVCIGHSLVVSADVKKKYVSIYEKVSNIFAQYIADTRYDIYLDDEGLIEYLSSMPLLATTEIDFDNEKFIFGPNEVYGNTKSFEIDFRPFLSVKYDEFGKRTIYVTSKVDKGEKNGEVVFESTLLNCLDMKVRTIRKTVQISHNEVMRVICKTLNIKTDWYPVEQCWCDLAFVQRLATVTENAILEYYDINALTHNNCDVKDEMEKMFFDRDIIAEIEKKKTISIDDMNKTIIGFFIKFGIFKTTYSLFLDNQSHQYGERIFDLFIKHLKTMDGVSKKIDDLVVECDSQIAKHLKSLENIVTNLKSFQYKNRSREIKAEWRAFTVLNIAGIHADNLFIDKEAIYSIDDYYEMFRNASMPIEENLHAVLSLITEVYGALLLNSVDFDENKYYSDIKAIRKNNKNRNLEDLFVEFERIVTESEGNPCIKKYLGREILCSKSIGLWRDKVFEALKMINERSQSVMMSKKYVFISYAHNDKAKVDVVVNKLRENGVSVFIDNERFKKGNNWKNVAQMGMENPDCACVLVFVSPNSATSEPVAFEVEHAVYLTKFDRVRPDLIPESGERFLQFINIHDESNMSEIGGFLFNEAHSKDDVASRLHAILGQHKLGYIYKKDGEIDKLIANMKDLVFDKSEEYIYVNDYTKEELVLANFYSFLKYGSCTEWQKKENIDQYFNGGSVASPSLIRCIYPIVASMKEAKIKRDNVTMLGYEMVGGRRDDRDSTKYILTSKPLINPDDYYCLPNYQTASDDCSWMADPFLISHRRMYEDEN